MDKKFEILLVEDNPADVRLTREALKSCKSQSILRVTKDGVEAMDFLHQAALNVDAGMPDLILLDLNLPRKNGREVLSEIKGDQHLKRIPIIIFTTSRAESDVMASYNLGANCYIIKPADIDQFYQAIQHAEYFWLTTATLAPH